MNKINPYADHLGIEEIQTKQGEARVSVKTERHHTNILGYVHGGLIYSLADIAFELASNSHPDKDAVGINTSIQFHKAVKAGETIEATANEVHLGNKIATYQIEVKTDDKLLASFVGTVYRMNSQKNIENE